MFGLGPAGTGKTYLAVAAAVAHADQRQVDRIVLSRPAVEAGERLGFLPGDLREKIDPYLRPLYDALYDMLPAEQVARRLANGEIEIAPLAFMRGRTLANAFVILDEAQNTTPMQMKMFLTRLGENAPHGGDRRPQPDRPAQRHPVRPEGRDRDPPGRARASASSSSPTPTWSATRWSATSSAPMTRTTPPAGRAARAADGRGPAMTAIADHVDRSPRICRRARWRQSRCRHRRWRARRAAVAALEAAADTGAAAAPRRSTGELGAGPATTPVQTLNRDYRDKDKPTNVLSFAFAWTIGTARRAMRACTDRRCDPGV